VSKRVIILCLCILGIYASVFAQYPHPDKSNIYEHNLASPVKNKPLIGMYIHDTWRTTVTHSIPLGAQSLANDLTRKAKARIDHICHTFNSTVIPRQLQELRRELGKGNSPAKVRKQAYKADDKIIIEQAINAVAAVAQLRESKEMQEKVNPIVRKVRRTLDINPSLAVAVPATIDSLLKQQAERKQSSELEPNLPANPPAAASAENPAHLLAAHQNNPELEAPREDAEENQAYLFQQEENLHNNAPKAPAKQGKKRKNSDLTDNEKARIKNEKKWLKINTENQAAITHKKTMKKRQKIEKENATAAVGSHKITDFF
jgi:hypothetical protein